MLQSILNTIIIVAAFLVAAYLQIIIHELGHLVMGLMTGYRFVSFRVGKLMLLKKHGKYLLKKFSLPGTGGQCLLNPPEVAYEKLPYKLYMFGGVIFNILASCISLLLFLIISDDKGLFFIILFFIGIAFAVLNGIPLNAGELVNDGYNAIDLSKDISSRKGLWLQLKINASQIEGMRTKDMPDEWFIMPENVDLKKVNVTSALVFVENRYMDQGDFATAREMANKLLSDECNVIGIYRAMVKLDLFYMNVLENNEVADISVFNDDGMVSMIMKQMKDVPNIVRSEYAKAVFEKDTIGQENALEHFEKMKGTYPTEGEYLAEEFLIQKLKEKHEILMNKAD